MASGACFPLDPTVFQKDYSQQWQETARTKAACWFCSWGEETDRLCLSSVPETLLDSGGPEQAGLWNELARLIGNRLMEIHILCHLVNLLSARKR